MPPLTSARHEIRHGRAVRATLLARLLLRVTVAMLPHERDRYAWEFESDCLQLAPRRQIAYAARTLLHAQALRRELAAAAPESAPQVTVTSKQHRDLRCMVGRHSWKWENTADGHQYRRCRRCGQDSDGLTYGWMSATPLRIPRHF